MNLLDFWKELISYSFKRKIYVFLIDGLGTLPLDGFEKKAMRTLFPSSTAPILTSLYSLLPVEKHGIFEWMVYREGAEEPFLPLPFSTPSGAILKDVDERRLFFWKPVFERMEEKGVKCALYLPASIASSPLSKHLSSSQAIPYRSFFHLLPSLSASKAQFNYIYFDKLDGILHKEGYSEKAEELLYSLNDFFAVARERLGAVAVLSDHGHLVCEERIYPWTSIEKYIKKPLFGSSRVGMVKLKEGVRKEEVVDVLKEEWGDVLRAYDSSSFFKGNHINKPDVLVLPNDRYFLSFPFYSYKDRSHHGGLSKKEMEIFAYLSFADG